jgi:ribosomal protein L29
MALPKIKDSRKLSNDEVTIKISEVKKELAHLRIKKGAGQNIRPHEIKHKKHLLGQLKTVESERERNHNLHHREEVTQKDFMNKIDAHLLFEFGLLPNSDNSENPIEINDNIRLNMLVHVLHMNWKPVKYIAFQESFRIGDIIGGSGNYKTVIALQNDPEVKYVEFSHSVKELTTLDEDTSSKVDLKNISPLTKSVNACSVQKNEKGDEAIVGIIDSGIDIFHEAFLFPGSNRSRIISIYDIANNRIYEQIEINNFLDGVNEAPPILKDVKNSRVNGHGTHVASIAAGSPGRNFHGGIAPEAQIIMAIINSSFTEGFPIDCGKALNFIIDRAKFLQKPIVINLSQGFNSGSHDGKTGLEGILEKYLDFGQKENTAIVKSAGNERKSNLHKCFNLNKINPYRLQFRFTRNENVKEYIDLWFSPNPDLVFKLINPARESSQVIDKSNKFYTGNFINGNHIDLIYREEQGTGDGNLAIIIYRNESINVNSQRILDGIWTLEVSAKKLRMDNPIIHAWIELGSSDRLYFMNTNGEDESVTITTPGNAENVIVVGSIRYMPDSSIEEDTNSSCGPTRYRIEKPEISAPGYLVTGAKAGTRNEVCQKGGTSAAAPHVTGAIALLLSALKKKSRSLTASQIRRAIATSSRNDPICWDQSMGYGLLDVEELFRRLDL